MAENRLCEIEERLANVPGGRLLIEQHTPQRDAPVLREEAACDPDGKGRVENWNVFPGVVLTHSIYQAGHCGLNHDPLGAAMQINHCRFGQAGLKMRDGSDICLGPGDLSLHRMNACAQSAMNFPLGYHEGIAILIDPDVLEREPPEILREAGVDGRQLYHRFCGAGGYTIIPASPQIDHIFSDLYALPSHLRIPCFKLKVQELLLFLSALDIEKGNHLVQYCSQQVQTIQAIHRQLTEHLDRRFTIEELSKQYLINTSSLKAVLRASTARRWPPI